MDLKEIEILGEEIGNHWYYAAKAKAMSRFLDGAAPTTILDVGAGSGFFSQHLLANSVAKDAWCVDISYESDADEGESRTGKPIHYRRSIGAVNADLVLLMDVLEHVDDDVALLKEYVQKVPNGSRFLITVPAFKFLWSDHDIFLDHKRRYTLENLEKAVRDAGLKVRHGAYYFGAVFPVAATLRLARRASVKEQGARSQLTKHHPAVNAALKALCNAELPFMSLNRIAGLTAFCLAQKA